MSDEYVNRVAEAVVAALAPRLLHIEEALARPEQAYFTIAEAAALVGVSAKHVRRAVKQGKLACSNLGSDRRPTYRIDRKSLDSWLTSNRLHQAPPKAERDDLVNRYFGKAVSRRPAPAAAADPPGRPA